ncbi:hypothetical protein EVAR_90653_1 [Eumeta japonica]|uniref:Uncharacterized protein n=1 Tax=Eumeta variegata TaxID=151549 RepID=A0A4C1ZC98_EUMVA|nr:hypothetical protein EVAR_90653_1 [Eumeta japonica]
MRPGGDEADCSPHPRTGVAPPPMFVQDKDRWTELQKGVPKIPVDEVKEDLVAQPSGSVGAPNTEPIPKTLDLVLVSGTAEANDKTKAAFFKIRSVCSSGVKAEQPARLYPGSVTTASPTGTRPVTAIILRAA